MGNGRGKLKKCILGILLVFAFSMLSAEAIPMTNVPVTVEAAKVKINTKKATLIKGQKKTLKITGTKQKVKWSTNKKSVATVTQKGKVTAKKKGKATITAKVGGKKYKCTITVEEPKLNKKKISLNVGKTQTLKMTGTKQKITWSSSDKKIAKVSNKGVVKGLKKGSATITAKVGGKKYNCKVTVKVGNVAVTGVSLNESDVDLGVGETLKLKATVSPGNATNKTVTWSSSDSYVASVDSQGVVTAESKGTAYIYAKAGNKKAVCTVTVLDNEEPSDEDDEEPDEEPSDEDDEESSNEKPSIAGELYTKESPTKVILLILTNKGSLPLTVGDYYLLISGSSQTSLWLMDDEAEFIESYTIGSGEEEMLGLCKADYSSFYVYKTSECCFTFWYDGVKYFADVKYTGGGSYEVYDEDDASAASVSVRKANILDEIIESHRGDPQKETEKFYEISEKIENKK